MITIVSVSTFFIFPFLLWQVIIILKTRGRPCRNFIKTHESPLEGGGIGEGVPLKKLNFILIYFVLFPLLSHLL